MRHAKTNEVATSAIGAVARSVAKPWLSQSRQAHGNGLLAALWRGRSRLAQFVGALGLTCLPLFAAGQQSAPKGAEAPVLGLWQAIDDVSKRPTALIRLEWHGQLPQRELRGRVERVIPAFAGAPPAVCQHCSGERQGQPVEGMDILWDLKPSNLEMTVFGGGTVLDPSSGKSYRATLRLRPDGQLEVRGFIGLPVLGRTQIWQRAPGSAVPATGEGPKINAPGTPRLP